jgi:hypothetical protein
MGQDRTTALERALGWLGLWGVLRSAAPAAAAVVAATVLLEILRPSAARLFPGVSSNVLHFLAVGIGLLLGLMGHFAADLWDRRVFRALYGPAGRWQDASAPPLIVFPPGAPLKRARAAALAALPHKPGANADVEREAVKQARRQAERWERIERPLILARAVRGFLWPCVFAVAIAWGGAIVTAILGASDAAPALLIAGAGCLGLGLAVLVPYTHLRADHLTRLYTDIAAHAPKKKSDRR